MTVLDLRTHTAPHAIHWTATTEAEPDYFYLEDPEETEVVVRWTSTPEVWMDAVRDNLEYEALLSSRRSCDYSVDYPMSRGGDDEWD